MNFKSFCNTVFLFMWVMPAINSTPFWGFYGHKKINNLAVFSLPEPLFGFYREHVEEITTYAVNADKRRHSLPGEAPKHYIDLDVYTNDRVKVFEVMPKYWKDAVAKYSEDTLMAYGILPWNALWVYRDLQEAFEQLNWKKVIVLSADLGHYLADAHVPLHTTQNYNGQLSNQRGIHAFWESRLPELFSDNYQLFVGKAYYIPEIQPYIWQRIQESHWALDSVLHMEKGLQSSKYASNMYGYEKRGKSVVKTYSEEYAYQYHVQLNGMVERRMKKAIESIASFWYTAWVNAGQPNLPSSFKKVILAADTGVLNIQRPNESIRSHE